MSSDNGIYQARFPRADGCGFEYRVIHAQAIENCDDDPSCDTEVTDAYRASYFGNAKSFPTEAEASVEVRRLLEENEKEDWGLLEYGVCSIMYDRPLRLTREEAAKILDRAMPGCGFYPKGFNEADEE